MDLNSFEGLIKAGNLLKPVLIFSGPEDFLKERIVQKIVNKFVPLQDQPENFFRYDFAEKETITPENQLFSFCFNPSPRVFWLQNFSSLSATGRKAFLKSVSQNGIPADTFLIFAVSDARTATEISTSFKQQSEKVDFWRPFENQLPAWVKKEAAELGGKIDNDAVELLLELAGSSLGVLFQELQKLVIAAAGKTIKIQQVKASVRYLNQDGIFDFLNSFGQRRTKEALRALEIMVNSGEAPQKIWFMVCRQLRDYRLLHDLLHDRPDLLSEVGEILRNFARIAQKTDFKANQEKKNLTTQLQRLAESFPPILAQTLNLGNPAKSRNLYMAMNFSRGELLNLWPVLQRTDLLLKSGVPDPLTTLQTFTIEVLAGAMKPA